MNFQPWGDLSSKRPVGCKIFPYGSHGGSIPNFPVSPRRAVPRLRSLHVGWPSRCCHLPVASWRVGSRPGRRPFLKKRRGHRCRPRQGNPEDHTTRLRPIWPASGGEAGHRWARSSCLDSRPAGPGGAPGPRVHPPAFRRPTPPQTASARSGAARNPSLHPP